MNNEPLPQTHAPEPVDESFWAALFTHEEAGLLPFNEPDNAPGESSELEEYPSHDLKSEAQMDPWQRALNAFNADETIDLRVSGYNKGGLLINWHGIQGFIPASQLIDFPQFHLESERIEALRQWQHKRLRLKILEVNAAQNRFILSQRAGLVRANERERLLNEIQPGKQVRGEVTNLTSFGAFVDLGGVEGLIHISELSWSRVSHPGDVVKPGQQVIVRVLHVDTENGRVALSLKQLKSDPWKTVEERFQPGQVVEGAVSKVVGFGAFVQIDDELEGLIHISELAEGAFLHPCNVVSPGQRVRARVLYVDGAGKRLALSLRGVSG